MDDLSHLADNSMWATSQHAGNRPSDASSAMTAPGTASPSVDESDDSPAGGGGDVDMQPFVQTTDYHTPVLRGPDGSHVHPDNADRSDPYTEESGGWKSAPKPSWGPS